MPKDGIPAPSGDLGPPPVAITTPEPPRPRCAQLTEIPLPGEEPDRGFETETGFRVRVRVRQSDAITTKVDMQTRAIAAPTQITLLMTVSSLTEDNQVERVDDLFVITDAHEITVTDEGLAAGFDLEAEIMRSAGELAARLEDAATAKAKAFAMLGKDWGIGPV